MLFRTDPGLAILLHVLEGGDNIARTHVAASQSCGRVVDARNLVDLLMSIRAVDRVAEGGFDLTRQMVAGRGQRVIHAFEDGERGAVLERVDDDFAGEWPEYADIKATGRNALLAEIV